MNTSLLLRLLGGFLLFTVAACSGGSPGIENPVSPSTSGSVPTGGGSPTASVPASGGGGSGSSAPGTGRLNVLLTDSPFSDADAVLVTFTEVSVHRTGGAWETLSFAGGGSLTCDLTQLQNLSQDVLASAGGLTVGTYTQIRLIVERASIHFDNPATTGPCAPTIEEPAGLRGTVKIPSGEVKLNQTFTIVAGGATTILLDFDGDASIRQTAKGKSGDAGTYSMKPVLRVVRVQ